MAKRTNSMGPKGKGLNRAEFCAMVGVYHLHYIAEETTAEDMRIMRDLNWRATQAQLDKVLAYLDLDYSIFDSLDLP